MCSGPGTWLSNIIQAERVVRRNCQAEQQHGQHEQANGQAFLVGALRNPSHQDRGDGEHPEHVERVVEQALCVFALDDVPSGPGHRFRNNFGGDGPNEYDGERKASVGCGEHPEEPNMFWSPKSGSIQHRAILVSRSVHVRYLKISCMVQRNVNIVLTILPSPFTVSAFDCTFRVPPCSKGPAVTG
jgi:hypothetical protein